SEVPGKIFEPAKLPGGACVFANAHRVPEFAARAGEGIGTGKACLFELVGPRLYVELNFVIKLLVESRSLQQITEPAQQFLHAVLITISIARTIFSNSFASRSGCLRPSAVRR